MELVITLEQLIWLIIAIILVAVGIYAAIALKNLTVLIRQINGIVEKNYEHLNGILPNIKRITDDTAVISEDLKSTVGESRETVEALSRSTREKVDKFSQTADNVGTYAVIAGEVAKVLIEVFSQVKRR